MSLRPYFALPSAISSFEREHLAQTNRIGKLFLLTHLPVIVLVAWFNDTNPWLGFALSAVLLAGPLFAERTLENPRHLSIIQGFTAMMFGGLLVHFGQGPAQIEMHFYFFVLLAMLAVYANPQVILVAAGTVAVHHLVLWLFLPRSVFNYVAPLWVVAVHALFVVLESIATCYIARSFFDNVIGLERIIEERTLELDARNSDMRLVLDHVDQGLATIDRDGTLAPERSRAFDRLLHAEGEIDMSDVLGAASPSAGEMFRLMWPDLSAGVMPIENTLDLMPKHIHVEGRSLGVSYTPIVDATGEFVRCLVVVADRTAAIEHERFVATQRTMFAIVDRMGRDQEGLMSFLDEARGQMTILTDMIGPAKPLVEKRLLHTLKGNAASFGLNQLSELCHAIETRMTEERSGLIEAEKLALCDAFAFIVIVANQLAGTRRQPEARLHDLQGLFAMLDAKAPHEDIAKHVRSWQLEPVRNHLERAANQARGLAKRLGKEVSIRIEDHALRLPSSAWSAFWASLTHVVRNAVDHGIEDATIRSSHGKPESGLLTFETVLENGDFVVRCSDDGRGIDFGQIASRASQLGISVEKEADLVDAMFADGITTVDQVTELSGRGVGMGAVRAECERLGGSVEVGTATGSGTRFTFRFPLRTLRESLRPQAA